MALKQCAKALPCPLAEVLGSCLRETKWPSFSVKEAQIVPVHKKDNRIDPNNYSPISFLSVVDKVAGVIWQHLTETQLLSNTQFGFIIRQSTADVPLLSKD